MSRARGGGGLLLPDREDRRGSTQHGIDVALVQLALSKPRNNTAGVQAQRINGRGRWPDDAWSRRAALRGMARTLAFRAFQELSHKQRAWVINLAHDPPAVARIMEEHTRVARIVEPYGPLVKRPPTRIAPPEGE